VRPPFGRNGGYVGSVDGVGGTYVGIRDSLSARSEGSLDESDGGRRSCSGERRWSSVVAAAESSDVRMMMALNL
jgi:hypothetical protein